AEPQAPVQQPEPAPELPAEPEFAPQAVSELALPTSEYQRPEIEPVSVDVGMIAELHSLVDEYRLGNRLERLLVVRSLAATLDSDLEPTAENVRKQILEIALEQSDPLCIQYALQSWGSSGKAAVRSLFQQYINDANAPNWMVQVIYEHSPENQQELTSLFRVAADPTRGTAVRMAALTTLSTRGPVAEASINFLCDFAISPREDEFLRLEALRGLRAAKAGTTPANQIEANLIALLNNPNESWEVRLETAHTLAALSPLSNQYVHSLCESALLADMSDLQRAKLLDVIADCNSPAAKELIYQCLRSRDELTQVASLRAVGRIGPLAGDLTDHLVALFQDDSNSQYVLDECAKALAAIGAPAVEHLNRRLTSLPAGQRIRGLNALASTGHHACMAMDYCRALLEDPSVDARVQCAAVNAIGRMGPGASSTRDALLRYLERAQIPAGKAAAIIALTETGTLPVAGVESIQATNPHPAIDSAIAFSRYIDGDFGGAQALVLHLLQGDEIYASQALKDIGSGAITPLAQLANDPSASANQRVIAMEILSQMPQATPSYLLPSLADEQLGRVCQECLASANHQDGGIQLVGDILDRLQSETDPQFAYRMEQVIENIPYTAPIPIRPDANQIGTRLATRLQQDHVSLVAYNAPADDVLQPFSADTQAAESSTELPIYTSLELAIPQEPEPSSSEPSNSVPANSESSEARETSRAASGTISDPVSLLSPPASEEPASQRLDIMPVAPPQIHSMLDTPQEPKPFSSQVEVYYGTNRLPQPRTVDALPGNSQIEIVEKLLACLAALTIIGVWIFGLLRKQVLAYSAVAVACSLFLASLLGLRAIRITVPEDRQDVAYSSEHNDSVTLGVCQVSIPESHLVGELERPSIVRFEFEENENKHIVLKQTRQLDADPFYLRMQETLEDRGDNLLVFVHGYNVSFEEAARRTAQMAYDLRFPGAPVFYSWPSKDNWYQYQNDRRSIELSVGHMKRFLTQLADRSGASNIHVIAHSMGNVGLTQALAEMTPREKPIFNQVVLAAPDIDAEVFRDRIAPRIVDKMQRCTVYTSMTDLALVASRYFNAGSRIGEHALDQAIPGVDIIDASSVDTSLLGHSYYGEETVLGDLSELLLAKPIDRRTYVKTKLVDGTPYRFVDRPYMASASSSSKGAADAVQNAVIR
ncbi:MAG: alpha/beta hydrolase, partial [Planctomycetota bacterium]